MTRLCLVVQYHYVVENSTYSWDYMGGCFPNNKTAQYEPAVKDQTYTFTNLPIEVQEANAYVP
eukprot:CAMPEP_0116878034 /NCGR_PEP_ID=MMETSP0463-20121206/9781_1 /TAXON_ID=181622 /ORGANISM="Strombidinopsis sp, Strain SopsisLIS2011" /LENGTH=62 /DNA_ID=CAMNT_0004525845 /DNA_START=860 /DNA_END=1048 /DNA_ORIENTATION=-